MYVQVQNSEVNLGASLRYYYWSYFSDSEAVLNQIRQAIERARLFRLGNVSNPSVSDQAPQRHILDSTASERSTTPGLKAKQSSFDKPQKMSWGTTVETMSQSSPDETVAQSHAYPSVSPLSGRNSPSSISQSQVSKIKGHTYPPDTMQHASLQGVSLGSSSNRSSGWTIPQWTKAASQKILAVPRNLAFPTLPFRTAAETPPSTEISHSKEDELSSTRMRESSRTLSETDLDEKCRLSFGLSGADCVIARESLRLHCNSISLIQSPSRSKWIPLPRSTHLRKRLYANKPSMLQVSINGFKNEGNGIIFQSERSLTLFGATDDPAYSRHHFRSDSQIISLRLQWSGCCRSWS